MCRVLGSGRCPVKWLWPRCVKGKGQILEKRWNLGKTGEDGERMRKEYERSRKDPGKLQDRSRKGPEKEPRTDQGTGRKGSGKAQERPRKGARKDQERDQERGRKASEKTH